MATFVSQGRGTNLCAEFFGVLKVKLKQRLDVVAGEGDGNKQQVLLAALHQTLDGGICGRAQPRLRTNLNTQHTLVSQSVGGQAQPRLRSNLNKRHNTSDNQWAGPTTVEGQPKHTTQMPWITVG